MTLDRLLPCQDPGASRADWTPSGTCLSGPLIPHKSAPTSGEPYPTEKQSLPNCNFSLLQA